MKLDITIPKKLAVLETLHDKIYWPFTAKMNLSIDYARTFSMIKKDYLSIYDIIEVVFSRLYAYADEEYKLENVSFEWQIETYSAKFIFFNIDKNGESAKNAIIEFFFDGNIRINTGNIENLFEVEGSRIAKTSSDFYDGDKKINGWSKMNYVGDKIINHVYTAAIDEIFVTENLRIDLKDFNEELHVNNPSLSVVATNPDHLATGKIRIENNGLSGKGFWKDTEYATWYDIELAVKLERGQIFRQTACLHGDGFVQIGAIKTALTYADNKVFLEFETGETE